MIIILIKQKRINSCKYFSAAVLNTPVYVRVNDAGRFSRELNAFGFKESDQNGTTILPCAINCYAKKNAEEFYTINRDLPMESYTQTVYWTRYEWAGKGQTIPVTDFSYINKKRFHRDYFAPYSVYFTLISDGDTTSIVSEGILFSEENQGKLLNTVNMILDLFGECELEFTEQEGTPKRIFVNWDVLPKGQYPWSVVKDTLGSITKGHPKTRAEMMLRNCEKIYAKEPNFVAYGRAGFKGYAVFGFTNRNLYILESVLPNNATYVLENNWEAISQLSKAEILSQELHKARIIHSENWKRSLDKILEDENG